MRDFEITNNLAELETLTEDIFSYFAENGISEEICYEIRLALEEAVSNTIKYGYDDQQVHSIHVRAGLENQQLILEIEDNARPFNPLEVPPPDLSLPLEKRPIGRLGIYLMRTVMDHLEYETKGRKNILRMIKYF